jgi:hypothetical protein
MFSHDFSIRARSLSLEDRRRRVVVVATAAGRRRGGRRRRVGVDGDDR